MKTKVYDAIKKMVDAKSALSHTGIGTDSLAMVLKINEAELMPIIEALADEGKIIYEPNTTNSRRAKRPGSVRLALASE